MSFVISLLRTSELVRGFRPDVTPPPSFHGVLEKSDHHILLRKELIRRSQLEFLKKMKAIWFLSTSRQLPCCCRGDGREDR